MPKSDRETSDVLMELSELHPGLQVSNSMLVAGLFAISASIQELTVALRQFNEGLDQELPVDRGRS